MQVVQPGVEEAGRRLRVADPADDEQRGEHERDPQRARQACRLVGVAGLGLPDARTHAGRMATFRMRSR